MNSLFKGMANGIYWAIGLKINKWQKQIEYAWNIDVDDYNSWIELWLCDRASETKTKYFVKSIKELKNFKPLSKDQLRIQSQTSKNNEGRFCRKTAGTTGKPIRVCMEKDELGRMLAVREYCFSHYGICLGDREARVWGRPHLGWKTIIMARLMNRKIFHPVGGNAVNEVQKMLAYRPVYIYGYASLILEAAKIIEKHVLKVPPIKCIICTAETILPSQKEYISRQFLAPVSVEYGSTEFDIVAFECRDGHLHMVNPWIIVEKEGDTILVSDVSRHSQPFIKYTIGDIFDIKKSNCEKLGSRYIIENLEGRSIHRFAFVNKIEKFHAVEFAHAIDKYCLKYGEIFDFKVMQVDYGKFNIEINRVTDEKKKEICKWIEKYIENKLGHIVSVCSVEILKKTDGNNNKRSYFIGFES
jgi:phenylacetate-CoA ligase